MASNKNLKTAQDIYNFKVVDRVSGKVIAKNFIDFCKMGVMLDKNFIGHVKNAEEDFLFIVDENKYEKTQLKS